MNETTKPETGAAPAGRGSSSLLGHGTERKCNIFVEDEEQWKEFLRHGDELELHQAIFEMYSLERSLKRKGIKRGHVVDRIDTGERFYMRRFKRPWVPW